MEKIKGQSNGREYEFVPGDPLKTRIYTLKNGLKVFLSPNNLRPTISTRVVVLTGSYDDPAEQSGTAHYLEHMMFKGTKTIGTTDYEAEKPLLDEIEELYEEYRATTDETTRKEIYRKIDSVSQEASKYCAPNEFKLMLENIGARYVNAATSYNTTSFVCTIPSGEIKRWAMIESDRFLNPVFRGFHTELETVIEEYNQSKAKVRLFSDELFGEIESSLYEGLTYRHHTPIGIPEHLKNPSIKKMKEFFSTYYCANNMALFLSGDLDYDKTIEIIEEYFSAIPRNESLRASRKGECKPLSGRIHKVIEEPGSEGITLSWRLPGSSCYDDGDVFTVVRSILQNNVCGILDDELAKNKKATYLEHSPSQIGSILNSWRMDYHPGHALWRKWKALFSHALKS